MATTSTSISAHVEQVNQIRDEIDHCREQARALQDQLNQVAGELLRWKDELRAALRPDTLAYVLDEAFAEMPDCNPADLRLALEHGLFGDRA